jgi:hypothetical protein
MPDFGWVKQYKKPDCEENSSVGIIRQNNEMIGSGVVWPHKTFLRAAAEHDALEGDGSSEGEEVYEE